MRSGDIILPAVQRQPTGSRGQISFLIPDWAQEAVWRLATKAHKRGGFFSVVLGLPARPRTTGRHSQQAHFNGHVQQVAVITGNSFTAVKERMKDLAVDRGYGIETLKDGSASPISEADATVEDAKHLIDTVHQWFDEFLAPEGYQLIEEDWM